MKHKLCYKIYICGLLMVLLTSCKEPTSISSIGQCIEYPFRLAFPTYATAEPNTVSVRKVLPGGDWKVETLIPNGSPALIASFVVRGENELWMTVSQDINAMVYRYRTDIRQWTKFIAIDGEAIVPQGLIVSPDGTLWGMGWTDQKLNKPSKNTYPLISRFDESAEQFRFLEDPSGVLESFSAPRYPPMVQVDSSGSLWMILSKSNNMTAGLFSFDPQRNELIHHLPDLSLSGKGSIAVAPNNEIWLFDPALKAKLIRYFPQTGKYDDSFINRSDWNIDNAGGSLYFDRSGRLWLGDNGWIDLTNPKVPVWYQIIRSPVFITDYYDGENQYVWLHPSSIFQSSNGWYWFSSPNLGIVRLDTNTEEWCRFTTEYSPVIEDSRQNIWIIVTDKLFVYSSKVDTVLKAKR